MTGPSNARFDLRGGAEAALQGISTAVTPILLFMGLFGVPGLAAGFWAALVAVTLVPMVRLLLGAQAAVIPGPRTASLATYAGLVLHLCLAAAGTPDDGHATGVTVGQLRIGLAAGSLMFAAASGLVLLSGVFRLGHVFKMIPTPVTAGISNGTALLLVSLAVHQVFHSTWLAAVTAFAMAASYGLWPRVQRHIGPLAAVPAIIMALVVGAALAISLEPAVVQSAVTDTSSSWRWISVLLWPELQQQELGHLLLVGLPGTVTLALVMILETFTANSVMETRFGVRINPNRELLALGGSNVVSALAGGVPCTGSPIYSVASWVAGGRNWQATMACTTLTAMLLLGLGPWLMTMPAGLAAGLLLLQASLMVNPAFLHRLADMVRTRQWRITSGTRDLGFWITFAITLVGFFGNLIWACFMGIALSCLVVLRRVSVTLTARWTYLDRYRSRRVRSSGESDTLTHLFHHVGILPLSGHLFFGNSTRLMQLADELHTDALAVVVDVSQVRDVDASGLDALNWLIRALKERQLKVVLSGLGKTSSVDLQHTLQQAPGLEHCVDLDRALEICENLILGSSPQLAAPLPSNPLDHNRLLQDLDADEVTAVLMLGDRREVPQGAPLFYKDAQADGVWLLEAGHVSILSGEGEASSRLATFGPGQFVGEMGLIDGKPRSATVRADSEVRALLLDNKAIATLIEWHPAAALKITRNIARELSHRVRSSSALLADESAEPSSGWASSTLTHSRF